jgi:hypothetical protein
MYYINKPYSERKEREEAGWSQWMEIGKDECKKGEKDEDQ